ncbi:MAG: hypothetical protein ACI361_04435 [Atopobiaceae bacterium]
MRDAFMLFATPHLSSPLSQKALACLDEHGLSLSEDALGRLQESESELLSTYGRLALGTGPLSLLAEKTASALSADALEETLSVLEERFFELRELVPPEISDAEIAEALAEALRHFEDDGAALADEDAGTLLALLSDFGDEFCGER